MINSIENCEKVILELIQCKSQARTADALNWSAETALNDLLCTAMSDLKKLIHHKRKTEPEPQTFSALPKERIGYDLEL
jgi:hypothetical protein